MLATIRQLLVSIAIIGIALAVGFLAADVAHPSPFEPAPPRATGPPTEEPTPGPGAADHGPTGEPSAQASTTQPSGDVAILVGAGDIAECDRFEDDLTADLVEDIPGIVFTAGDNANPGTRANFERCYGPTWGRPGIWDRTRPAAGDADYEAADAAPYYEYFGDAAGPAGAGYYAYDAGTWRVYVLNSNCGNVGGCRDGSPQATWLAQDLAAEPRPCVLAIWHHAFFSSGPSGGGTAERRDLWRILEGAGAELVVSGHDHHYERFAPQTVDGKSRRDGMVQFVVGTGGSRPDVVRDIAPNSKAHATGVFEVLRLELRPGRYAFEFIAVSGPDFGDSGAAECHDH